MAGSRTEEQYIEFNQNSIRKMTADVVVTNCQAASYRNRAVWSCKAVLADRGRLKESKYAHLAVPNQAQIIGLSFDALGGMGPHAQELINYICVLSQESPLLVSPRDFASLLRDRISIALAERAGALIQEGESRVLHATDWMSTARPPPATQDLPAQSASRNLTRTRIHTLRTAGPPPNRSRWIPVRRNRSGGDQESGDVNGGLSRQA